MKYVIDIPEVYYDALKQANVIVKGQRSGKTLESVIFNAVGNATPYEERPKGEWIEFDHGMGLVFLKCPFCGEFQNKADNHNFCPNCGARMDGEQK